MIITDDLRALLATAETEGTMARFPQPLDRSTYTRLNRVLVAAGGYWSRGDNAHVFPTEAADVLDLLILGGEVTTARELGHFPTPAAVAARLLDLANLEPGMLVLEPSAGTGELVRAIVSRGAVVDAVELVEGRASCLRAAGSSLVVIGNFLDREPQPIYSRIIMNPPFARQADITHVVHALKFLRPGGRLVSVMTDGVTFRSGAAAVFRELVARACGTIEALPPGSFASVGTAVHTVLVMIPG